MKAFRIDGEGRFEGYASLFGVADQSGDVIQPGAFARSLSRRSAGRVRMLFQHDPKEPVGVWQEISEDRRGLFARGQLARDGGRAEQLGRLIDSGALDGLSIGFRTVRATRGGGTTRRLQEIDLWEVSIVTFPMLDGARIAARPDPGDALRTAISMMSHS